MLLTVGVVTLVAYNAKQELPNFKRNNNNSHLGEYIENASDTDSPLDHTGGEWTMEIEPSKDEPILKVAPVSLFIPPNIDRIRAILIFFSNGVGEQEYEHEMWRTFAATHQLGLMKVLLSDIRNKYDSSFRYPEQSARMLSNILNVMGDVSKHQEVRCTPFVLFGHSSGGFLVTRLLPHVYKRTVSFVAFHGSVVTDEALIPESVSVPGLFLIAGFDPEGIRHDSTEHVERGRSRGARWSLVVEPDAHHWDIDSGRNLIMQFVEETLRRRIQADADGLRGPAKLTTLPEQNGWLGQLEHHSVYDGREHFKGHGREVIDSVCIAPYENYLGPRDGANWMISKLFAENWLLYQFTI